MTGPVELWSFRKRLRLLISDKGSNSGADAGNEADHKADDACPNDMPPTAYCQTDAFPGFCPASLLHRFLTALGKDGFTFNNGKGFGDGEQTHERRD